MRLSFQAARAALVIAPLVITLVAACGDDTGGGAGMSGGGACLPALDLECTPAYPPTFDQIHTRHIAMTCGAGGTLCHGPMGNKGNLVLDRDDADQAYEALLDPSRGLVIPGDPECSTLIKRVESEDPSVVMPVGMRLMPGQRCAIRKWVADGAKRR